MFFSQQRKKEKREKWREREGCLLLTCVTLNSSSQEGRTCSLGWSLSQSHMLERQEGVTEQALVGVWGQSPDNIPTATG